MAVPSFRQRATVNDKGVLELSNHQRKSFLEKIKFFQGKNVFLIIQEDLTPPTVEQRGYYYAVLLPVWKSLLIQQSIENNLITINMLHRLSMRMFLPKREIILNAETGETIELESSTKKGDCSKEMYSIMIEGLIRFLHAEYDEDVPEPNTQAKIDFKNFSNGKKIEI